MEDSEWLLIVLLGFLAVTVGVRAYRNYFGKKDKDQL